MLTTLDRLERFLGVAADARLQQILAGVSSAVESWCGRSFHSVERTEFYDGTGRELLPLRHRPVTAVTDVRVDAGGFYGHAPDSFGADTVWVAGEDYVPTCLDGDEANGGLLLAIHRRWPEGRGNVRVQYTAGYTEIPEDLELAVHMLCATVSIGGPRGGHVVSETIGRYTYRLLEGQQFPGAPVEIATVRSILARYKELAI